MKDWFNGSEVKTLIYHYLYVRRRLSCLATKKLRARLGIMTTECQPPPGQRKLRVKGLDR